MLIRDSLHGDIELTAAETVVLDCAAVQRMRGIKQLGTAYLVYPGATHSRFEHSLGTCNVAHRIVGALRRLGTPIDAELEERIGVAALLHDVTHVPFGHTLEDERRLFPRHDKGDRLERLLAGELGEALDALGLLDAVGEILGGAHPTSEVPAWARDIVSSAIDADLLDYLRRDSLYTGLAQDYDERVFRYFAVAQGRLALSFNKHGMDRPDARSEVVQLLRMRYFLTERVYYHHTKVVAGAMISKAVELALDAGALAEPDLLALNDWTLLHQLAATRIPAVIGLIDRLQRRQLLKRAYVISARSVDLAGRRELVARYHQTRAERGEAERALAAAAGCAVEDVVVYCPALTLMKEAEALVDTPRGVCPMSDAADSGAAEITALAERHAALWRLYVFVPPEHVARVQTIAAEYFGRPSEYRPRPG
jgi:HD superfamily phosphohydrolase